MRYSTWLAGLFVVVGTNICLGQAQKLRQVIHDTGATCNTAAVFRIRVFRGKETDDSSPQSERIYFQIRTRPEPKASDNVLLVWLGRTTHVDMHSGEMHVGPHKELHARVKDRIFASNVSNQLLPFSPREITPLQEEEAYAKLITSAGRRADMNPLALPFLTTDAFYSENYDLPAVKSRFRLLQLAYEDKEEWRSVWTYPKNGNVVEVRLSPKSGHRPVETSYYNKKPKSPNPEKGKELGELVYRTQTTWEHTTLKDTTDTKAKQRKVWLPKKIVFEQFPHGKNNTQNVIEIVILWRRVSDDILSVPAVENQIPIAAEIAPPNEPISELYYNMLSDLEALIEAEEEKQ